MPLQPRRFYLNFKCKALHNKWFHKTRGFYRVIYVLLLCVYEMVMRNGHAFGVAYCVGDVDCPIWVIPVKSIPEAS
jgi:hypothetical protein